MTRQRIVITGAASGIGAATVRRALQDGHLVAGIDLEADKIGVPGTAAPSLSTFSCDVSEPDRVNQTIQAIVDDWDAPPTALVHCAGIYRIGDSETLDISDWDLVQSVNTRGSFLVAQAAAKHMLHDQTADLATRSIVLLTSVAHGRGDATEPSAAYAASKGAVVSLTRQLAVEWGPRGIRTNAVAPGVIDTAMTIVTKHPKRTEALLAELPLRRLGTADDIASACLFLIRPESSYINGVILPVDGGYLIS